MSLKCGDRGYVGRHMDMEPLLASVLCSRFYHGVDTLRPHYQQACCPDRHHQKRKQEYRRDQCSQGNRHEMGRSHPGTRFEQGVRACAGISVHLPGIPPWTFSCGTLRPAWTSVYPLSRFSRRKGSCHGARLLYGSLSTCDPPCPLCLPHNSLPV